MRVNQCGITKFSKLDTPFGSALVDTEMACTLNLANPQLFSYLSTEDDLNEHSLEQQFPFVYKTFDEHKFKILPIQIGLFLDMSKRISASAVLMQSILKKYQIQDVVFVISSDFCHYGHRFEYIPTPNNDSAYSLDDSITQLDLKAFQAINSGEESLQSFLKYLQETSNTICGQEAILLFLEILKFCKIKGRWDLLHYAHSNYLKTRDDHSVSYIAAVYYEKGESSGG